MTKYDKDTLENLIAGERHRLNECLRDCIESGNMKVAEYWQKEIEDLERLDSVIWQAIEQSDRA
jgi:hypothetical protein